MKRRGFTLIELMITAAIIVILTGSSTVVYNNVSKNNVENAGMECKKIINLVKNEAVATREWRSLVLHYSNNTITYTLNGQNKTYSLPITVKFTREANTLNCWINYGSYTDKLRYNNDYIDGNYDTKDITIWFNPYGKPNIRTFSVGDMGGDLSGKSENCGFFTLSSSNDAAIAKVLIYSNTGESELEWIKGK